MLIRSAVSAASTDYVGTGGLQRGKRREAMAGCTQKKCSRCNNKNIRTREEERPNDRSAKSDQQRNNKLIHIHHFFFNGPLSFPSSDSVVAALNCRGMETLCSRQFRWMIVLQSVRILSADFSVVARGAWKTGFVRLNCIF